MQGQTRLSHILFVCFWALASLALIVDGLFANPGSVTRQVTFVRSDALTLAQPSTGAGFDAAVPPAVSGYGQPAPKANLTVSSATLQTATAISPPLASTPQTQAAFHTLRAAASDKIAWQPTATATAAPSTLAVAPARPPTAVAYAARPGAAQPTPTHLRPATTLTPAPVRPATATPTSPMPQPTATPPPAAPDNSVVAAARSGIVAMLAQRQQAVNRLDGDSFISTVDPQATILRAEQTVWFDNLRNHPPSYYALALSDLTLMGSTQAVGTLTERSQLAGQAVRNVSAQAVFVQRDGQWYYDDLNFEILANGHFTIRFFAANRAVGNALFSASLRTYAQITADLGAAPPGVMEVKLYPSEDLLQDSVMLGLPTWVGGWSMPGQSIKTAYNGAPTASYVNLMAHEFTHQVQASLGLNHANSPDWLNEGLAVYEAELISPDSYEVANRPTILRQARAGSHFFAWASFPPFQQVTGGQVSLAYEQAYSGVQYLLATYGRARFNAMLGYLVAGNGLDEAFTQAFGVSLAQFDTAWRAWLAQKYK